MFIQLRKYRNYFTTVMLGFYLAGGLQFPMLECLHFLTHIDDLVTGDYQSHAYISHDGSHHHNILQTFQQVDESTQKDEAPSNESQDLTVKKFPQILNINPLAQSDRVPETNADFFLIDNRPDWYLAIPCPPPRA